MRLVKEYSLRWGVSAGQVSQGWEWRMPMRKQPRDRRVPLPTSNTMNLKPIHCYHSAINPSALCSGLQSIRWIHHYSGHLCMCASSLLSGYSNHEAHQHRLHLHFVLSAPSYDLRLPLVLFVFPCLFLVLTHHCSAPAMSRIRGKSKHGSVWKQNW
jgi:hypothetical protein